MPTIRKPRKGSMQFWPRVRAKREYPKVKAWAKSKDAKPLGFAGYKVGMTHTIITDNSPHSTTKGKDIFMPVTVIECPPLKVASIRFYKNTKKGKKVVGEVFASDLAKEFSRKTVRPKSKKKIDDIKEFDDVVMIAHTQPKLTKIGKKKPELFEVALGGKKEDKLNYIKERLGKEITIKDVFKEGQQLDMHVVTTGKGFQGPVKRFGISLRSHKSEKAIRNPGSLGPWKGMGQISWRVARAGKMGYHVRTEYNKWLIKIGEKPEEVNAKGGFLRYGAVKNNYILIKGSVGGPSKRLVRLNEAIRTSKKIPKDAPTIQYLSTASKQGN